jgi:hypothetical protein
MYLLKGQVHDIGDKIILAHHVTQHCSLIGDLALCTSMRKRCRVVPISNVPRQQFPDFFMLQIGTETYEAVHHSQIQADKSYGLLDLCHVSTQLFIAALHSALTLRNFPTIDLSCYVRDVTMGMKAIVLSIEPGENDSHAASAKSLTQYLCAPLNATMCSDVIYVKHCDELPRRTIRDLRCGTFMVMIARQLHMMSQALHCR